MGRGATLMKNEHISDTLNCIAGILADGTMDLKDTILKICDVVVASVHSRFV